MWSIFLKFYKTPFKEEEEGEENDHPLDSISLGILESRSFLFLYDEDDDKENKANKTAKARVWIGFNQNNFLYVVSV